MDFIYPTIPPTGNNDTSSPPNNATGASTPETPVNMGKFFNQVYTPSQHINGDISDAIFQLGFINVGAPTIDLAGNPSSLVRRILCEEITIGLSYDLTPRHVSDQVIAVDTLPTKQKITFKFKKPKNTDNDLLFYMATYQIPFMFDLYRIITPSNDKPYVRHYLQMIGCMISSDTFGDFTGKPVTEEIEGQALYFIFDNGENTAKINPGFGAASTITHFTDEY